MEHTRGAVAGGRLRRCAADGFSLIELLVVVAVLGVLAAVAVPSYVMMQNGAKDASLQSDLLNAKKALVAFGTDHGGDVPMAVTTAGSAVYQSSAVDLRPYGWTAGADTRDLSFSRGAGGTWCVLGTGTTGSVFAVTTRGAVARTAVCPG